MKYHVVHVNLINDHEGEALIEEDKIMLILDFKYTTHPVTVEIIDDTMSKAEQFVVTASITKLVEEKVYHG